MVPNRHDFLQPIFSIDDFKSKSKRAYLNIDLVLLHKGCFHVKYRNTFEFVLWKINNLQNVWIKLSVVEKF